MSKWVKDGGQEARTANDLSILDMNVKYLLNRTHCVHENIFYIVSFRQFNWDLPVRYASIGNNIEILIWRRAMQISRKRKRKKECECKNLKNGEMHGSSSMGI